MWGLPAWPLLSWKRLLSPTFCLCVLQVFGEGVVNDAVSVVLLGAVAAAAHTHGSEGSTHRLAGGIVANFVWLLVTSLLLGGAAGLGIAVVLKKLRLQGAHQVSGSLFVLRALGVLLHRWSSCADFRVFSCWQLWEGGRELVSDAACCTQDVS